MAQFVHTHFMKPRKPRPAIFLEAARLIAQWEEWYACTAIQRAAHGNEYSIEQKYFCDILQPKHLDTSAAWYGTTAFDFDKRNQTARILGLCLCASLAKEGFTP